MNLWDLLLIGFGTGPIGDLLSKLPLGTPNAALEAAPTIIVFAAVPLLLLIGNFVNLSLFASYITTAIVIELARLVVAIYRFVLKVIPLAN